MVIFLRGLEIPFCTPHRLFSREAENALPQESSVEIVDVWNFSLARAHTLTVPTHTWLIFLFGASLNYHAY